MTGSRTVRALLLLALVAAALVARLFQVQVAEHVIWAREASRLVREGREVPYKRGRILDAKGRVLARDEERRSVALVYREFRRDHPLGQVVHARSLLEGRPLPVPAVSADLVEHARVLVSLGPRELRAFAAGEGLVNGAPVTTGDLPRRIRARRASDLVFYLRRLLGLEERDQRAVWKALRERLEDEEETRSILELTALVRRGPSPREVELEWRRLEERLRHSLERLGVLARWVRPPAEGDGEPLARLLADLERARREVEDATAAKLFSEAAGFVPGRVETDTLTTCLDHGWISAELGWDPARVEEWAAGVRAGWLAEWRDRLCLPGLFWSQSLDPLASPGVGDFIDRLAVAYQPDGAYTRALEEGPRPWRTIEALAVFEDLEDLFEADPAPSLGELSASALPIQVPALRDGGDDARVLPEGRGPESFLARLQKALESPGRAGVEARVELAVQLAEAWELRYQGTLRRVLDETRQAADADELGPDGALLLLAPRRGRAAERAQFFLKDFGSRPFPLSEGELTYDVVYLLTRYEHDFPGFTVRDLEVRARVELEGDDRRPADRLVGVVSAPTLHDLLRQREEALRMRELKARPDREDEELEELQRLIGEVRLPSEVKGVTGIEAWYEPELTGINGFTEQRGLADVFGASGDQIPIVDPVDGQDVLLTLDADLQAAAQRSLRSPEIVDDPKFDHRWQRAPVGAVVLLSIEGDVLAAASEPDDQSPVEGARGERLVRAERTLTKRTFQPPGSSFKVFVAAWALDHGLDPLRTVVCGPIERGGSGYKDLRCWNTGGHGPVNLRQAIVGSCNAYFAWLGEQLSTEDFSALCTEFGFGQPTGVRTPPPWDAGVARRAGLVEHLAGLSVPRDGSELSQSLRRMTANGLGRIEATPMQVARGILGLATGKSIDLRLAQSVGGRELPPDPGIPLAISSRSLDLVRSAMRGVAQDSGGTAHNALKSELLGFPIAVKTGSADLQSRNDEEGRRVVRKHAWVAGWVPADDPQMVFVVFQHDTSATSSHGAVYLTRQILRQPEVLLWLAERGVDLSRVPAR